MFTGLIQETGVVSEVRRPKQAGKGTRIVITSGTTASELKVGDSVAVSGVCLTAVDIRGTQFAADLAQETLERTSLAGLRAGSLVNLELPARAQDRLGGHVVQGHVDGAGKLVRLEKMKSGEDWRMEVEIPPVLAKYVVPQGSITVEGISLTVAAIESGRVEIAIIPHTYQATNLHSLRAGDLLNIEVDVLAKYAEKIVQAKTAGRLSVAELIKRGF